MPNKTKPKNKFAAALKSPAEAAEESIQITEPKSKGASEPVKQAVRPSRKNTKHVGGYYDPAVSKQLRTIALEEDSSVQALVAEGIDLLFQSRRKPTIAQKSNSVQ